MVYMDEYRKSCSGRGSRKCVSSAIPSTTLLT